MTRKAVRPSRTGWTPPTASRRFPPPNRRWLNETPSEAEDVEPETTSDVTVEPPAEPQPELAEAVEEAAEAAEVEAEFEAKVEAVAAPAATVTTITVPDPRAPEPAAEAAETAADRAAGLLADETALEIEATSELPADVEGESADVEGEPAAEIEAPAAEEGPEPARIPTSLTATLREQGPRYLHRVSRRMRRRGGRDPRHSSPAEAEVAAGTSRGERSGRGRTAPGAANRDRS